MNNRFVNEKILLENLPVFLPSNIKTEEQLESIIDLIEETLILEKAEEIKKRRNNE
jgi:hypothetical protein